MNTSTQALPAVQVKMTTTFGPFILELYPQKAPETVANFLQYVENGHYNGTIFHRVIPNFMVQGGGYTAEMDLKATAFPPIKNEAGEALAAGLKNDLYTIAMARTNDPHSATCQFFINVVPNDFLDFQEATAQGFGYCVFGKVVQGHGVVDQIKRVRTHSHMGHRDVPVEKVEIHQAEIVPTTESPKS